jgi:hypothetical protein
MRNLYKDNTCPDGRKNPCEDGGKKSYCRCKNEQTLNDLIKKMALVKTSLASILNAEGAKIQKAVEISNDVYELIEVNHSAYRMVVSSIQLEQVYYQQLDWLGDLYRRGYCNPCQHSQPCCPECSCHEAEHDHPWDNDSDCPELMFEKPCCPESDCAERVPEKPCRAEHGHTKEKPCMTVFFAETKYLWTGGTMLNLEQEAECNHGITLCRKKTIQSYCFLPVKNI